VDFVKNTLFLQENLKIRKKDSIFGEKLSVIEKNEANLKKKKKKKTQDFPQITQCVGGIAHIVPPVQVFKKNPLR